LTAVAITDTPVPIPTTSVPPTFTPTPVTVVADTATAPPATEPAGACANDYLPVVEGATFTFAITTPLGDGAQIDTITDVGSASFLRQVDLSNVSYVETWHCEPDGLVQYASDGGIFAAVYQGSSGTAQAKTLSVTGVTLPAHISAGDTWTQVTKVEITGGDAPFNATFTYNFQAAGAEDVTVGAGTFTAMRVNLDAHYVADAPNAKPVDFTGTDWFAPGAGLVKTVATLGTGVTQTDYTLALEDYNIP
jgi:hypothetical protein